MLEVWVLEFAGLRLVCGVGVFQDYRRCANLASKKMGPLVIGS